MPRRRNVPATMPRRNNVPAPIPEPPKGVHVPSVPGITAQIISQDKKAFPNHRSPDAEPITEDDEMSEYFSARTITTYIAVTNDTPFSIHLRVDRPYPKKMDCSKLQFQISIDGKFVWDAWCHRPRYEKNGSVWEEIVCGMKEDKGHNCKIRGFKFKGIKTNDEDISQTEARRIKESLSKIGEIEIKVYKTTYGKKGGDVKNTRKGFLNEKSKEVPEKALKGPKAQSHGTAFDEAEKKALKCLHVIERTPTPSRSSSPESEYDGGIGLTAAQEKQMKDLKKKMEEQMANLKRSFASSSGGGGTSSSRKKIKREDDASNQRAKRRRRVEKGKGKADPIDLTGDDSEDEEEQFEEQIVISDDEGLELDDDDDDDDDDEDNYSG